jgi:hypothetical protein
VNFSGIDPGHLEARTTRGLEVPQDIAFSRAEAATLGLSFPAYTDMLNALNHTNYTGTASNLSGNNFGLAHGSDSVASRVLRKSRSHRLFPILKLGNNR